MKMVYSLKEITDLLGRDAAMKQGIQSGHVQVASSWSLVFTSERDEEGILQTAGSVQFVEIEVSVVGSPS